MPLAPGCHRPGRAQRRAHVGGAGRAGSGRPARAPRAFFPRRAARARPSRRDADPRPHDPGGAARGDGGPPSAAHPRRGVRFGVAATAPFGADVLERLAARGHEIPFLLTTPDKPSGRGRKTTPSPAKEVAERLGIPVLQPDRPTAELELPADTVVIAAYGRIVPTELLERALWLNVHPSLLPRWRGAGPVERAIMAGDRETGVTIHKATAELDAGPIAAQRRFPIGPEDDAGVVFERAASLAVDLLDEVFTEPTFVPQPDGATYAEKISAPDRE